MSKCKICRTVNISHFLFTVNGQFCNRTCYSSKLSSYIKEGNAIKNKLNEPIKSVLGVCKVCACEVLFVQKHKNVLGVLTQNQRRQYTSASKMSLELLTDGYVILNRDMWQIGWSGGFLEFPIDHLPPVIMANKNRIQTIKDKAAKGNNIARRFMPLKIDAKPITNIPKGEQMQSKKQKCDVNDGTLHKHQQSVCNQLSRITNCDIYYAYVAMKEREILAQEWKNGSDERNIDDYILSFQDHADLSICTAILKQMGMGVMFRGYDPVKKKGVTDHQISHADNKSGNWVVIIPLSDDYTINVWKHTHLVIKDNDMVRNAHIPTLTRQSTLLHLNRGQVLLFHPNLWHSGGVSSEKTLRTQRSNSCKQST